jgi:phage gp16-like protein
MTAALIRTIQVGCKQLGIDAETRHELQLRLVGKSSLSDMTDAERQRVLDELKTRGFTPSSGRRRPQAPRGDLRLVHVLWAKLGQAGALKDPTRRGLNAFVSKRFGRAWGFVPTDIDALRDHDKIDQILQALKQWGEREKIDFDWTRIRK